MTALLSAGESWRVAALTMMGPKELAAALSGENRVAWIEAAAACGIAEALVRLGRMNLEGEGVRRNEQAAFRHFRVAAAQGDIEAHNMLGRCYENGWGTIKDHDAAMASYRVAAEGGLDWAQYNLGHMHLAAGDRKAAFGCYGGAAAQGHVRAMNLLGRCHEQGWGTARNSRRALFWYRQSARGGYFRGAFNYASQLAERGLLKSAGRWLERALAWAPEATRSNMISILRRTGRSACRPPAPHVPGAGA